MAPESENNLRLEIGHVLFIDLVGYSKLLIEEQKERLRQLTEIVLATSQVAKSTNEQLVRLPTGDGMALVFRNSSEEPARCALEIAEALKKHPEISVRMGIHSGPVSDVTDVSGRNNIAGAGINMAQRVMDCGDAGHILLSKRVAEDLESYRQWAPHLHSLGECEVKHAVRIHLFNFYTNEMGNAQLPEKFRQLEEKNAAPIVSRREEELRIAVLPFKSAGDAETESFAEGLVEDVTTGLSRFGYLSVVAGASDARYVLKGSIRKGGSSIRVIAQLVDTRAGTQLWAETYNRDLHALTIFDAQEDIAARIVATVADSYGVLVHSMREASDQKDDADFTPAEWQFQYFAYREQITPASHGALRSRLEARRSRAIGLPTCGLVWHRSTSTNTRLASPATMGSRSIALWQRRGVASNWIGRTNSRWWRWRRPTSFARTSPRSVPQPSARWPSIRLTPTRSGFWDWKLSTPVSSSAAPSSLGERWS